MAIVTPMLPQVENLLEKQYENKIRPYIDLIDSLRALGVEEDLALPAIAVIGDQSSGKSSVLEALSEVSLPRGSGIVTRCPLELKLRKSRGVTDWTATISYRDKKETLHSPSRVEQEVRKAQNIIAGTDNGISDELITLEIVSPNVPDLTLIDLPGITRIAMPNQPKDIGKQIKLMIKKYISRQETINLAVVPCNVDVATTEALEMAREVDPTGNRTIGILTKPDLIDKGTEMHVLRTVQNDVYHLKKGYMIVKCRGQKEIDENISLQEALENEKAFFENNQHFRALLRNGQATIPNLAERLTTELVTHIVRSLPDIKYQINNKLREAEDVLNAIGQGLPDSEDDKILFLVKIITEFTNTITHIVNGEHDGASEDLKLFKNLRKLFGSWDKLMKTSSSQFVHELKKEKNSYDNQYRGRELYGFINYKKFENILHKHILSFQEPAINILHDVSKLVQSCCTQESSNFFEKYKNLNASAVDKIQDISRELEQQAENTIKLQFQMEGIIYCQDSIYCKALSSEKTGGASGSRVPAQEQSQLSMEELANHLQTYLTETTSRLSNQIPLIIQHYILKEYAGKLHNQMILLIQNKQNTHLLEESHELAEQRHALKNQIQRLRRAQEHLSKFPGQ
ncbi:PREDICTED: interferon-induced GTP-binding protein Mx1 [Nanorana parkeri]|uniref:interferon-induced GTP-binding protein Mx1 n=1 Tax=Nanorana parkeri TaxID=125878 RepID=UPI000854329F|nr:PREDICTED: interferon-induced GTP-binding protein Mx1 [Nanorana parkeri]